MLDGQALLQVVGETFVLISLYDLYALVEFLRDMIV